MLKHPFLEMYFKPKVLERNGLSSIYTYVGINFFKKYVPTSGDLVYRYRGKRHLKFDSSDRCQKLLKFELKTRKWEFGHIVGMIGFLAIAIFTPQEYQLMDFITLSMLFLLINIYPILLQRHNRIRIINILRIHCQISPYE